VWVAVRLVPVVLVISFVSVALAADTGVINGTPAGFRIDVWMGVATLLMGVVIVALDWFLGRVER
jgi:hypothetical protein